MHPPENRQKILVVDADPGQLRRLEHGLKESGSKWIFAFLDSSKAAREMMVREKIDVVVAGMNLSAPQTADLFSWMKADKPNIFRVALVSPEEKDEATKCARTFQQQLSRHCSASTLESVVGRGLLVQSWLNDERLKRLLTLVHSTPSVPQLYFELLEKIRSPASSVDDIAEIIRRDVAMTAKILQLVNSPFFALRHEISNVLEAVMFLGLEKIKGLVLMVRLFSCFESNPTGRLFSIEELWKHSLLTADLAVEIGRYEGEDPDFLDETYTAGILHDVGKLVLASNDPNGFDARQAEALQRKMPIWKIEEEKLGVSHAELGGCLVGMWGLSLGIVEAVAFHHQPARSKNFRFSPLAAVHMADALDNGCRLGDAFQELIDQQFLEPLGKKELLTMWMNMVMLRSKAKP